MNKSFINSLLQKFASFKVLVVGDVMLDTYLWGSVNRISPEAPVPVVMRTHTENRPGGAANVALNIHSLGAMPVMCSVIGDDENAKAFKVLIGKLGITDEGLIESSGRVTTCKTRIIAGHQQLLRIDQEDEHYLNKEVESVLWNKIQDIINQGNIHAIIFQDYDKGVITPGLIENIIALGKSRNIPTLVDPKKRNFNAYRDATLFKPNFKELVEGLNIEVKKTDFEAVHNVVKKLQKDAGFEMVMVTLSEHGMYIGQGNDFRIVPTEARDVADVSGAGDTVIAMASLCLAAGLDPFDMALLANLAAGLVCEKVGVVPVEKEWILQANISFGN